MPANFSEALAPLFVFGAGIAIGYWIAPNNWYQDRVQTCLDIGIHSDRTCFIGAAEQAYEQYLTPQ